MNDDYWWSLPHDVDPFKYAEGFVGISLLPDVGVIADNRKSPVVTELEKQWFRPAIQLQVAGMCLMAAPGRDATLAGTFTCYIVDHLLMAWNSLLVSHTRVAYTLARHVIEAAIFSVASVTAPREFGRLWHGNHATGGKALKLVQHRVPNALFAMLQESWRFAVSFGHVSPIPSYFAKIVGAIPASPRTPAVTFAGPHNGPLHEGVLFHLGGTLTMLAETSLYAFQHSFARHLEELTPFVTAYSEHTSRITARKNAKQPTTGNA